MTSSYLQRIVARMGTTATSVGPLFTPPDAPAPAIFDPFADAEPLDPASAPPAPQMDAPVAPPSGPALVERTELQVPGELVERVIHEPPLLPPVVPPAPELLPPPMEAVPLVTTAPLVEPELRAAPPIEVTAWDTLTQIVQQFIAPPEEQAAPGVERALALEPSPPVTPEIAERVRYEFIAPPEEQAASVSSVEPPLEAEAPPNTPLFESSAPQITIGDIVVEVVTRPEAPNRAQALPPRAAPPPAPPAPTRVGVPSKRGYGIGQL